MSTTVSYNFGKKKIQKLGYMKLHVHEGESTSFDEKTTVTLHEDTANGCIIYISLLPHAYHDAGVKDLRDLLDLTGFSALQRASEALSKATTVLVITTLEDRCVLVPMQHSAEQCCFSWRFHDGFRDADKGPSLDFESYDVVVVISTAPHHPYNTMAAWVAHESDARVIGITDRYDSPVGRYADDVLIVPVPQRGLFKSYVAATALAEMLVLMAAGRRGAREAAGATGRGIGGMLVKPNAAQVAGDKR